MAKRRRSAKRPIFQIVFALSFLLAIALFGVPKTPVAMLIGFAALAVFSTVVALGVTTVLGGRAEERWEPGMSPTLESSRQPDPWAVEPDMDLYPIWKERDPGAASNIDTGKWSPELLRRLEWRRFEELCAAYFEALEFRARTTRFGADGGIDIKLYSGDSRTPAIIVQCKAWNVYTVGVKPVRELRGVMAAEKVGEGVFITSGAFTKEAKEFASQENIHLIDGNGLVQKILALPAEKSDALLRLATQGDFTTPTCPSCGVKMTRRESRKDGKAFWGCVNYPRCRQTFFGLGAA